MYRASLHFIRQFKLFIRIIHEKIRRNFPTFTIGQRSSLANILNETRYMFDAPIFSDFIKYSWKLCGYLGLQTFPEFVTPPEFCFKQLDVFINCQSCASPPFIRCSWCKKNLCFDHFLKTRHRCN